LHSAHARFLQIADDFTFLNPHLTLFLDWHTQRSTVEATDASYPKWRPNQPTCAHWYQPEHFSRLVAAYIAHDADRGKDRTVRELVSEFAGLSSTATQRSVLEATGMARTKLSELAPSGGLDSPRIEQLIQAMRSRSRPVKPVSLGAIGREHLETRLAAIGCEMESFQYRKATGVSKGVPWIVEAAFAWRPGGHARRLITGVNWSPGILNPFRELGAFGESLDSLLQRQRAGHEEPVVLVLHMACPRVAFADRGKSSVIVED
jgi:DNA topoisomerase VI subunit B